jgi:hypothetical protein
MLNGSNYQELEHLQPLALFMAKFGAKLRRIERKLGVGSRTSSRHRRKTPGNQHFWLIFTNKHYSSANFIQFANIWLK